MTSCVIGHTGFIGGHLVEKFKPTACFNSKNISDIAGQHFDTIYCAGNSGTKWMANKNPEDDWKNIKYLMHCLSKVQTNRFVLISTIDVYTNPFDITEECVDNSEKQLPYGLHRHKLEKFVRQRFANSNVLRLPIVYGRNFKKNVLFDLINNHELEKLDSRARVQMYFVGNLGKDVKKIIANDIKIINLAVEPITAGEIANNVFGFSLEEKDDEPFSTDMRTKYGSLYGTDSGYLYSKESALNEIRQFVLSECK